MCDNKNGNSPCASIPWSNSSACCLKLAQVLGLIFYREATDENRKMNESALIS
jgi:hypothetical protein